MIIVDATDTILGRLASFVAKKALSGEEVVVVNSERAVVSGRKNNVFKMFEERRSRGTPSTGPFYPKQPHLILKRAVRGMLPYKKPRGRDALKRVKCYKGVPKRFEGKELVVLENAKYTKLPNLNYVYLEEISKKIGAIL